jgi:hypothetical protein
LHTVQLEDGLTAVHPQTVAALLSALKEKFRTNVTNARLAKVAALRQPGNIAVPLLADVLKHF